MNAGGMQSITNEHWPFNVSWWLWTCVIDECIFCVQIIQKSIGIGTNKLIFGIGYGIDPMQG